MRSPAILAALAASLPLAACGGLGLGGGRAPPAAPVVAAPPPPSVPAPAPPPAAVSAAPLSAVSAAALPAAALALPAPPPPTAPAPAALASIGGPVGPSLTDADRLAAFNALGGALESGQRKSWRGAKGVFGFIEPGAETGGGCRAYSQTIYVAGRPNKAPGTACKQADGTWLPSS